MNNTREKYWHTETTSNNGCVSVRCCMNFIYLVHTAHYVYPPNWFERLRGITFEAKVNKAIDACNAECIKLNNAIKISDEIVDKINEGKN